MKTNETFCQTADAASLIDTYLERTGIQPADPARWTQRYLWTDAYAVQSCFGLARSGDEIYRDHALALIEAVHTTLGRHREDEDRQVWISGLPEDEGRQRPTVGGLRIGKPLAERPAGEGFDESAEWERDGQYFHYLTRWIRALMTAYRETSDKQFRDRARELMATFESFLTKRNGESLIYWKMSVDLTRPQVSSMGALDPLDGLICAHALGISEETETSRGGGIYDQLAEICRNRSWATTDSLGIGGLLLDIRYLLRCREGGVPIPEVLDLNKMLLDTMLSLDMFRRNWDSAAPPDRRLAFRESGLSLGLHLLREDLRERHVGTRAYRYINSVSALADEIDCFWINPEKQDNPEWKAHEDINAVMLAASSIARLVPNVFSLYPPGPDVEFPQLEEIR